MKKYSINETSKITHTSVHTLRYYDKISLVSPKRATNNYRYYTEENILTIKYIKVMKQANFNLEEIALLINQKNTYSIDCNDYTMITSLLEEKTRALNKKVAHLTQTIEIINCVKTTIINKGPSNSTIIDESVASLFEDSVQGDII